MVPELVAAATDSGTPTGAVESAPTGGAVVAATFDPSGVAVVNSRAWATAVLALYGRGCVCCGDSSVELDHIWPKSQGGIYHPGNGAPLCSPWSRMSEFTNGCHKAKTDGKLQYRREWLHPDTVDFLAAAGWVWWGEDGQTYGRGCRHFAPVAVIDAGRKGG